MDLKLLVVDDAPDIVRVVVAAARMAWPSCRVITAASGSEALQLFSEDPPDLVVLDVSMPPPDGFSVCRQMRKMSKVPILMLTVRNATLDKIQAFDLGADDYMTKPFDALELQAHLRALMLRAKGYPPDDGPDVTLGDLSVNFANHEVRLRGEILSLTSNEYHLLEELVNHAGQVLPHEYLLKQIWGPEYADAVHYLKVLVGRLRRKLGDDTERPRYIHTEWGLGYRFITPN